jgi:hypothetical protein
LFPKIPIGVANRQRTPDQLTTQERRQTVGALIFTVSVASRQRTGNNAKQYETGEILGFDNLWLKTADPMLVSEKTDIQHNLNMYNYPELGLTQNDVDLINEQSLSSFDIVTNRLNNLRVVRADAEVRINTTQKTINEANKNIAALEAMLQTSGTTDPDIEELLLKLRTRKLLAEISLAQAVQTAKTTAIAAEEELNKLRAIAMVLK